MPEISIPQTVWALTTFMRIMRLLKDRKIDLQQGERLHKCNATFLDTDLPPLSFGAHKLTYSISLEAATLIGNYRLRICMLSSLDDDAGELIDETESEIVFGVEKRDDEDFSLMVYGNNGSWSPEYDLGLEEDLVGDALSEKVPRESFSDEQALELIASWVAYLQNVEKAKL